MQLCTGEPLCDFPRHFAQIQAFSLSVEFHLVRIISLLVAKLLESENDNDERKQIGMTCGRNTKLGADDDGTQMHSAVSKYGQPCFPPPC